MAALFGRFSWEKSYDLDEEGHPTEHCIDELKQLYYDFRAIIPDFSFGDGWKDRVLNYKGDLDSVLSFHEPRVPVRVPTRKQHTSPPPPPQDLVDDLYYEDTVGVPMYTCTICGKHYERKRELDGHMKWKHQHRSPNNVFVIDNKCTRCGQTFSRKDSALRHVERNKDRLVCNSARKGPATTAHSLTQ